jgi:hypothetical protein
MPLLAAGELGGGHRFRADDGGRVEFAPGDLVHVRRNDYRSRRGDEPDVLNGFRGVALQTDERRGVLVEWHRPDGAGGHHTDSAWMSPRDVAEGRLTHGYAMTIGSAQGLTSEVTIASGHGADAHSLYPALSRARQETHLFLPLRELEDDVTRLTLGEARTEAERLDRAVAAYGHQLERDQDDVMVLDELTAGRAPERADEQHQVTPGQQAMPSPAQVGAAADPAQRDQTPAERAAASVAELAEQLRAQLAELRARVEPATSAVPGWREREHGRVATKALLPRAEKAEQEAAAARAKAAQLDAQAERLAAVLGTDQAPGARRVAKVAGHLDTAEQLLGRAAVVDQDAKDTGDRAAELYATNREEMRVEAKIRAKAAHKLAAVTFQRKGMVEAADALRDRTSERTGQAEALTRKTGELRHEAEELRRQAKTEVDSAVGSAYGPVQPRIDAARADLPRLTADLDRGDRADHRRLLRDTTGQWGTVEKLTDRAAGLRGAPWGSPAR